MEIPRSANRRTALKGLAATLGVTGTGLAGLALTTDDARAQVTTDLSVPNGAVRVKDGHAIPWLQVTGQVEWADLDVEPDGYRIDVAVGQSPDNLDRLKRLTGTPFGFDGLKSYSVQAPLTDAGTFASTDFQAPDAQAIEVTVYGAVTFDVLRGDEVLVSATATDSGALTVEDTSTGYNASISGTGGWAFQLNSTDPTPTPP